MGSSDPTPEVNLDVRLELPDALRVLLEEYPRALWKTDPNFSQLIRFWLDRHLMFRRVLKQLQLEAESCLDRGMEHRDYAARLSRLGGQFLNELHGHHMIEDSHYFPQLKTFDPRLTRGFDILDRDHHAIDAHLADFAAAANAVIGAATEGRQDEVAVAGMGSVLATTDRFLDRHLVDEEELVVPVLLKFAPVGLA